MAKKAPAKKLPAKRKPRAEKPVDVITSEFGKITSEDLERAVQSLERKMVYPSDLAPIEFPAWLTTGLKAIALLVLGAIGGVWGAGGIDISPSPGPSRNDCLSQSHAADRVSQVRILREYSSKSFPDEPTAQKWLNDQRIEARKTDWIPYTDELGVAADSGVDAVKALADKLEGKR